MDMYYGKKYIKHEMICQINELFATNYKNYHYDKLLTYEGIVSMINNNNFECIFIIDDGKICGLAGYYIQHYEDDIICEVLLSHLLVDKQSRGKGYGNLLEDSRIKMIEQIAEEKIVFASCVERPYNSIYMKYKRGFYACGFRYRYRPAGAERDNAVLMLYDGYIKKKDIIHIESPSKITKKLMKQMNDNLVFDNALDDIKYKYTININKYDNVGRTILEIGDNDTKGEYLDKAKINYLKNDNDYVSVHVKSSIKGFRTIDLFLTNNGFIPTAYIPYVNNYYGKIEYQYLRNDVDKLLNDYDISEMGKRYSNILCKYDTTWRLYEKSSINICTI